jgi:hypothetical protein
MTIKIKVTKDVLRRSANCKAIDPYNCAIANAVREFFPGAAVVPGTIYPFCIGPTGETMDTHTIIGLPEAANDLIYQFDACHDPVKRANLPELIFEIHLTDQIINRIGISQAYKVLSESKTLELVSI